MEVLVKNRSFGQKYKFWSNIEVFGLKSKFFSKIGISSKIKIFTKKLSLLRVTIIMD